jgi:branched-subunit amino acid aminotransferase/4-amino-4-deoxychorismate lyase
MSEVSALFDWHDGVLRLLEDCDLFASRLEVADSFLVRAGRTLAIDVHRNRFIRSAIARGYPDASELDAFFTDALQLVPRESDWFPRLEVSSHDGAFRLHFRLRSAPELQQSVVVATHRGPDPRTEPTVKGPDLDAMLRLRQEAQRSGAREAVILDAGLVSEGSTSALMWWRGEQLMVPPSHLPRIPSVTARSIMTVAAATGAPVAEEEATPADLAGCEVWAVNALHGIRVVRSWVDGPHVDADGRHARRWRPRLTALSRPLD